MARKAGLGRGLDALFADAAPVNKEEYAAEVLEDLNQPEEAAAGKATESTVEKAA